MAPRGCPAEFRRRVIDLVEAGRPVAAVVAELGIIGQSIYAWCRQAPYRCQARGGHDDR